LNSQCYICITATVLCTTKMTILNAHACIILCCSGVTRVFGAQGQKQWSAPLTPPPRKSSHIGTTPTVYFSLNVMLISCRHFTVCLSLLFFAICKVTTNYHATGGLGERFEPHHMPSRTFVWFLIYRQGSHSYLRMKMHDSFRSWYTKQLTPNFTPF